MIFEIIPILPWLTGLTLANLYVSHLTEVKQESESFSVMCRDKEAGAKVSWKGPKYRALGLKTNPQARTTTHGIQLIFNNIRKEDAGIYTCKSNTESIDFELIVADENNARTSNKSGVLRNEKIQNVYYNHDTQPNAIYSSTLASFTTSAHIEFLDTPTNVSGREGSDIVLKCEARGAEIEWLVNNEPPIDAMKYLQTADALIIRNASAEDSENEYLCKAYSSTAGSFKYRAINVTVERPPRLKYAKENILYGYLGGVVNLTCEVDADPAPVFKWYQKGEKYKIIGKEVIGSSPTKSVLMLVVKDNKDFGDYKCEAKNSHGSLDIFFTVFNGTKPSPPLYVDIKGSNSSAIFLQLEEPEPTDFENSTGMYPTGFRVEFRTDDEFTWNAQRFILNDDKQYILSNLAKNTTYQLRVATENVAGFSEFTNITEYATSSRCSHGSIYSFDMILLCILLSAINNLFNYCI